MKIALIGTHGVGKSTAVLDITTELKKMGKNVAPLMEQTAFSPFPINQGTTKRAQLYLLGELIKNEQILEENFDYVVCDRSALDTYIYTLNAFGGGVKPWEGFILDYMGTYDFLFKLPIKREYLKEDGVRAIELDFQKKIDVLFDNYLYNKEIDHIALKRNEDYAKQVLSYLKDKL